VATDERVPTGRQIGDKHRVVWGRGLKMPASHYEVELIAEKSIATGDQHECNYDEPSNHQHTGRQPRQRRDRRPGAFRCRDHGHAVHLNLALQSATREDPLVCPLGVPCFVWALAVPDAEIKYVMQSGVQRPVGKQADPDIGRWIPGVGVREWLRGCECFDRSVPTPSSQPWLTSPFSMILNVSDRPETPRSTTSEDMLINLDDAAGGTSEPTVIL
jgi:hypothetical protein